MKTVKPDEKLLNAIQAAKASRPDIDVIAEYGRAESVMEAVERIRELKREAYGQYLMRLHELDGERQSVRGCCKHWSTRIEGSVFKVEVCEICGEEQQL